MARIRDQIVDQQGQRIVDGLHLGVVREGRRLPSVRAVAREVGADPRVVLPAYRQLEEEGLVRVRARSGIYVATAAGNRGDALPQLAEWIVGVLVQALVRGVSPITFPERVRRCLETVAFRTACIECNRDQIAGLCGELGRDYGLQTTGVELEALGGAELPDEVRTADLLVTTSFHAGEVQRVARLLGKPWIAVRPRADFPAEISRLLSEGPVYFVASDERFAGKLRQIFSRTGREESLRVLIVGRDELEQIPAGAPTYVMPAVRPRLEGAPLGSELIAAPRIFSEESARELLSYIVRANLEAERSQPQPQQGAFGFAPTDAAAALPSSR